MRIVSLLTAAAAAAVAVPSTSGAQEGLVSFPFDAERLEVRVASGGGHGSIQLVDGTSGRLTVSELDRRMTALEYSNGRLSLSGRADRMMSYRVEVPPGAALALTVDGERVVSVAATGGGRRVVWRWGTAPPSAGAPTVKRGLAERPARTRGRTRGLMVNAFSGSTVVDSVDLAYSPRIRAFRVVLGGDRFRVVGDRAVRFGYHEPSRWGVITPLVERAEITMYLPSGTSSFRVRVDETAVWELGDSGARALCEPVAEIERPDGARVWVFTPVDGALDCRMPMEGPQPAD